MEIAHPFLGHPLSNAHAQFWIHSALQFLPSTEFETHRKVIPYFSPDGLHDLYRETHPALEIAPVPILSPVGVGRHKGSYQIGVPSMKLKTIIADPTRPRRCPGKVLDDLRYLLDSEFTGHPKWVVRALDGRWSRIWLKVNEDARLEQMIKQLQKLVDVAQVERHGGNHQVFERLEDLVSV